MAREQHSIDARKLKELSSYNVDDWGAEDMELFDKWMFPGGKWDSLRDLWEPKTLTLQMAAYLAHLLAKENNKP